VVCSALSLVLVPAFAGCGGSSADDEPAAAETSTSSSPEPSSTSTATPSSTPSASGDRDVDCLVSGSPWQVSLNDLESQFPAVLRGINVTSVRIAGGQTLTVDAGLHATFTDNSTTTIRVDMSQGLTMVMVQKHRGSASGTWQAHEGKLVSTAPWTGGIRGSTKVTINGRSSQAPFQAPSVDIGGHPMTYSCADGSLNLTVEGSPFSYLLT
jgi:hypothetical protein